MKSLDWRDGALTIIDQTALPQQVVELRLQTVAELVDAIQRLAIRGAPAIGVAGAFGVVMADREATDPEHRQELLLQLRGARPTAVNLAWAVDAVSAKLDEGPEGVLAEAMRLHDHDIAACHAMSRRGADLVEEVVGKESLRVMTICNTGALATLERGTALGVVEELLDRGRIEMIIACETRPLLQGARLTAWELDRMSAPYKLIVDGAAASVLAQGGIDVVLVGADRVVANGDTANKIGTFSLALGAQHAHVPFIVVAPESTLDLTVATGDEIEIEDRGPAEVVSYGAVPIAPAGAQALNPAFDVTPGSLITAVVTEERTINLAGGDPEDTSIDQLSDQAPMNGAAAR